MSSKKTCDDAILEVSAINEMNNNLQMDYDNNKVSLQTKMNALIAQRDAIAMPSRNINDYKKIMPTGDNDRCGLDGERYTKHKNDCAAMNVDGFGAGAYEWDGKMAFSSGICLSNYSGSCCTYGECSIKQSFIDGLAANAQSQKDNLNTQINQLISQIAALKPQFLPVPSISCCQSINLNNVAASSVTFDDTTQTCVLPSSTASTGSTSSVTGGATSGSTSAASGTTSSTSTVSATSTKSYLGVFLFIIFLIVLVIGGACLYIFADDLGLGEDI